MCCPFCFSLKHRNCSACGLSLQASKRLFRNKVGGVGGEGEYLGVSLAAGHPRTIYVVKSAGQERGVRNTLANQRNSLLMALRLRLFTGAKVGGVVR
jgi:hypothetical protein